MNRTLRRPMFRLGGPTSEGITSGLGKTKMASADMDMKIKQLTEAFMVYKQQGGTLSFEDFSRLYAKENFNKGGRVGYQQGTTPNFQFAGMPGFLTGLGLNLLATPPQGNIFQTTAVAARDPFNRLQASQAAAMKTASDRAFARELSQEEREFEEGQLEKKLEVEREKIAKMGGGDRMKRIESAKANYGGNEIKASREIDFYDNKFTELQGNYGDEGVFIDPVDLSVYESQRNGLEKFVKQNPQAARQVVYDVATGKAVRIVKDVATGKLKVVPADSADIDTTGEGMPAPRENPGLFGQPTKPPKELKEILPDLRDSGFDEEFYQ